MEDSGVVAEQGHDTTRFNQKEFGMKSEDEIHKLFEQFEKTVARIPQAENDQAKSLHPRIRECLSEGLPGTTSSFLSGSYARKTQTSHLHDIDIICVLEDDALDIGCSATAVMRVVSDVLMSSALVHSTELKVRAVKAALVDYDFTVDVVPALPLAGSTALYLPRRLPSEGCDDWTLENPRAQIEAAQDKNRVCSGTYVRMVRLAKYWNKRPAVGGPLSSYHVEALVWHSLQPGNTFPVALCDFLRYAHRTLSHSLPVTDPGRPEHRVEERMTDEDRRIADEEVETALRVAEAAIEEEDATVSAMRWRRLMGEAFPLLESAGSSAQGFGLAGVMTTAAGRSIAPRSWGGG